MLFWLRHHIRRLRWLLLTFVGVAGGVLVLSMGSRPQRPPDQRSYWAWVASIQPHPEKAVASGLALLDEDPGLHRLYLRLARVCMTIEAREACREAVARSQPPDSRLRLYKEAALALLDQDEAVTPWQQLARAPELDPALARLIVDETWPDAVDAVEVVWRFQAEVDTAAVGALFGLGYAAVKRQRWEEGEALLRRTAALAPDDPQAYRELGRIYYHRGETDTLVRTLETGIEVARRGFDPEQELILRGNLGWVLLQRDGDLDKAEGVVTGALEKSRFLSDEASEGYNLYRLASIYHRQQRYEEAVPLLRAAEPLYARHMPHHRAEVVALHGMLLGSMFRFSDAERVLERAVEEAKASRYASIEVQALVALAQLYLRTGCYEAARRAGEEALALSRRHRMGDQEITTRLTLGDIERRGGNYEGARGHYLRVAALARTARHPLRLQESLYRLGLTALDVQDARAAGQYFESMLKSIDDAGPATRTAYAYLGLGRVYARLRGAQEALPFFDRALDLLKEGHPARADVLIARAWTLVDAADFDEARTAFETARRLNPASPSTAYRVEVGLGDLAFHRDDCAAARRHFERAGRFNRRRPNPSIHWYAVLGEALAYWCEAETEQAEAAFLEAIRLFDALRAGRDPSARHVDVGEDAALVYEAYTAFLEQQGRVAEAFSYVERARTWRPFGAGYDAQPALGARRRRLPAPAADLDRRIRTIVRAQDVDVFDDGFGIQVIPRAPFGRSPERNDVLFGQAEGAAAGELSSFDVDPVSADAARAALARDEAMVVYDVRRWERGRHEENVVVAYLVLPDRLVLRRVPLDPDRIEEAVHRFREQLGGPGGRPGKGWEPLAQHLYQALIAPLAGDLPPAVTHLHIVPESILYDLPFAALQDAGGRFLVERFTLSTAPSAGFLKQSRDRTPRRETSLALGITPDNLAVPAGRDGATSIYRLVAQGASAPGQAASAARTVAVMVSLWPVDPPVQRDVTAAFREALEQEGTARALALVQRRHARASGGRHPFYWAPFMIVGDPF